VQVPLHFPLTLSHSHPLSYLGSSVPARRFQRRQRWSLFLRQERCHTDGGSTTYRRPRSGARPGPAGAGGACPRDAALHSCAYQEGLYGTALAAANAGVVQIPFQIPFQIHAAQDW
jgi:hypothetical protein